MRTDFITRAAVGLLIVGGSLAACSEDVLENGGVGGGPTSGSTTIATGQGGATSTSTSSGGPVTCPTSPTLPFTNLQEDDCQLLDRSSCTEPGFGCQSQGDGTTECAFSGGVKEIREGCTDNLECKAGLLCISGKCSQPCCRETGEPCGSGECTVDVNVGNNGFIYFCLYPDTCIPFQEPCPNGQACIIRFATDDAICTEIGPTPAAEGEPCTFINGCSSGLICDTPGIPDVCRYPCLTDGSSTTPGQGGCPMGQSCEPVQGFDNVGVCRP